MLKQGEMTIIDYEHEFSWLSKYALQLVSTEEESYKRFLRGIRDDLQVQLVLHKIKEFADLAKREKLVEQVLGLEKKDEFLWASRKRVKIIGSQPLPRQARESRSSWKSILSNVKSEKDWVKQPLESINNIK